MQIVDTMGDHVRQVHVWIPADTRAEHRSLIPTGIVVHDLPSSAGELPEHLGSGQFLVATVGPDRLDQLVARIDGLEVVQTISAGVDRFAGHIPDGVQLCDGSGIHDSPVAEWIVMVTLASLRELPEHLAAQREGTWRAEARGAADDLEGSTVLIVGYGSIGRALEERLVPFGVHVLRVGLHRRQGVSASDELPNLLPRADVVVILVPLTHSTRGLVNADFIALMRRGSLLVNASRGPIVDTRALDRALREGRVRAALDVTDPEPLPPDDPLWSAPGLLLTPHVAGFVRRRLDRSWQLIAEQLRRFESGEPLLNIVTDGY